ncbi:MAG: hypothetical protein M1276_00460, partial [Deltaproteobacteria bacterium]|nr:hypothetical protein [Deltaproteobacteria bacterium]
MNKPKIFNTFFIFVISFIASFILNSTFALGVSNVTLKNSSKYYHDALKGAVKYKYATIKGTPVVYGYNKAGKFMGYIFLSINLVDIKSYSGKPLVSLISINKKGII